jgi:tetratricopeptide (TPR) repeat protein
MMDALISGVAARVAFLSGSDVTYIDAERPEEPRRSSRAALRHLFGDAYDVELIKGVTEQQAFSILLKKWNIDRAMRMLQIILDASEDRSTREDAESYLSGLLRHPGVKEGVENATFSLELPDSTDSNDLSSFPWRDDGVSQLVAKLIAHQGEIAAVRGAWNLLPDALFGSQRDRCATELLAISSGAFRILGEALKDLPRLEQAIFECYFRLRSRQNHRNVVQQWTKDFSDKRIKRSIKRHLTQDEQQDTEYSPPIDRYVRAHESFNSVRKQKQGVIEQLERGNETRARVFTEQLINWQLQNGGTSYAAKSLCSLAQEARRVGNSALQLEWVTWATQIAPEDAWAHGQAGDAYFSLFRFNEAFKEYEAAARWGMGRRGEIGKAKVLAATGHLDDALRVCEQAIAKYPKDPEAHRSHGQYSEILREMWRFEDALHSYEEAIERYPDQSNLRCGRAAVLTDMGHLQEALEAYEAVIEHSPGEVVPWSGRADVLKEMGKLEAALEAYDETVRRFPFEPVPISGRADVLRSMGRFDEALAAYQDAKVRFPYEPAVHSGLGEVYRELGRFDAALEAYNEATKRFPHEVRVRNGFANVLRSVGRFDEALQEYDRVVQRFSYDLVGWSGRANLLKALGYYEQALEAYDFILERQPDNTYARNSKAAIYAIQGRFGEALELLPNTNKTPRSASDWVSFHIRGMLHLKKGECEAALEIFTHGASNSPNHQSRRYFENALAATKVRLRRFDEAIKHVQQTDSPISHLLLLHSYAALGRKEEARREFTAVNDNCLPPLRELRDEIAAQFDLVDQSPKWEHAWIIEKEIEVLLQAA